MFGYVRNKDIVLIGASTGGPNAIETVVTNLSRDLNVTVLVVQHMPSGFTKSFAERLDRKSQLVVVEATDGMKIEKNTVYIAPGGSHMKVTSNGAITLTNEPLLWGVRPAVDKLFKTAAAVYGSRIISVILTGMGKDGAEGTAIVKEKNGVTIAQNKESSIIYGMPKVAYETGCVDYVLPLKDIASKITSIVNGN